MNKWYLQTWLIALLFALWILIIPPIIGIILLVQQGKQNKKLHEEWEKSGFGDIALIQKEKETIEKQITAQKKKSDNELKLIMKQKNDLEKSLTQMNQEKEQKEKEIVILDDELLYQSYGFYDPKYNFENSAQYKDRLDQIREKQKTMAKNKLATFHLANWTLEGSKQKGNTMNNNNIKLTIRAFNNECDAAISKVKFNNIDSIEKRIKSAYDTLNRVNKQNQITIKQEYISLKLEELYLVHEYESKKREELEEQRQIKEQMREEKRVQEEIERMKKKIEKEETHFKQAIMDLQYKKANTTTDKKQKELEDKIRELEDKLLAVEKDKEKVFERETNTRAGYVYIISNVGSFGEGIYKIGMTRRLEPLDRVKELGDASVPFTFDIHAMIFSEDAPKLEKSLHESFKEKRVNMVNERKEFFKVQLSEIENVVRKNHTTVVEFTQLAQAEEYRQTMIILESPTKKQLPLAN
jgi:hypothetical protein